ncbi:MAG: cytidylate kinase-like family protein, partial [Balneolaceae bacterium]
MSSKLTKIVEDRIKSWEHSSSLKKVSTQKKKLFPVITISREYGAKGAALADIIGKKVGFKIWNRELLQTIAEELGSDEQFLKTLDERRREMVEDAVLGFLQNINTNVNYLRTLIRVVKTIEEHGNAIIVGRGANYICENPHSFHVRLVSPLKKIADDIARKEKMNKRDALSKI